MDLTPQARIRLHVLLPLHDTVTQTGLFHVPHLLCVGYVLLILLFLIMIILPFHAP